jgi:hypothetical protein
VVLLSCLQRSGVLFSLARSQQTFSAMVTLTLITNVLVGIATAVGLAGGVLIVLARRAAVGSAVDLRNVSVSRQWLMEHQSIDQP